MKSITITILITFFAFSIKAQNTFPSSGNVGIGNANPGFPLSVYQPYSSWSARFLNGNSNVYLAHGGNYGMHINTGGNNDASKYALQVKNSQSELFYVRGDGNVGIGTSSPSQKLQVVLPATGVTGGHGIYLSRGSGHVKLFNGTNSNTFSAGIEGQSTVPWASAGLYVIGVPSADLQDYSGVTIRGGNTQPLLNADVLRIQNYTDDLLTVSSSGNVGIGTTTPDAKLTVKGDIHAEEVTVDLSVPGPDYVFEEDYDLTTLEETEDYIKANKHLPEIPSAKEMEAEGIDLGEMNMLLLKKIEELTLHLIQQQRTIEDQNKRIQLIENQ